MTPETAHDRLATAVHQAVLGARLPESLIEGKIFSLDGARDLGFTVHPWTFRATCGIDLMGSRESFADLIRWAVEGVIEQVESTLASERADSPTGEAWLVHLDQESEPIDDLEPAWLLPGFPVWATLLEQDGKWRGGVRLYCGIATPT